MNDLSKHIYKTTTERLTLETLTPENMSDDYIDWLQDPQVLKYLEVRHTPQTRENITEFVNNMHNASNNLMLGIFLKDYNKHIGNIKLGPIDWRYKRADIGIIIGDKNQWGKGYAPEAIEAVCSLAFNELGLSRVQAGAYASNVGSQKAFEKVGFHIEGSFKNYWQLDNEPEDNTFMARLKDS